MSLSMSVQDEKRPLEEAANTLTVKSPTGMWMEYPSRPEGRSMSASCERGLAQTIEMALSMLLVSSARSMPANGDEAQLAAEAAVARTRAARVNFIIVIEQVLRLIGWNPSSQPSYMCLEPKWWLVRAPHGIGLELAEHESRRSTG